MTAATVVFFVCAAAEPAARQRGVAEELSTSGLPPIPRGIVTPNGSLPTADFTSRFGDRNGGTAREPIGFLLNSTNGRPNTYGKRADSNVSNS